MIKIPPQLGSRWKRLLLSNLTPVVPSGWTNSVTETPGKTGITNLNITATGAGTIPQNGIVWSFDTGCLVSDDVDFSFLIELTNAGSAASAFGSAQADGCFFWFGIASDVADLANRSSLFGYEHDGVTQPRGMFYQASGTGYTVGNNFSKFITADVRSVKNFIKIFGRLEMLRNEFEGLNLGLNSANQLTAAATTDSLKIVFAAGRDAAGSYNIPVRLWYYQGKKFGA